MSRHAGPGQEQHARGWGGRVTDLSSCCWKCWTFIWCTVLFRSHRNLEGGEEVLCPQGHCVPAEALC